MATRLAISAALLLSTLTAHAAQAQEQPTDDTLAVAAQAGVPASDVQGALNALADAGMPTTAAAYLTAEGDLPVPVARPAAALSAAPGCDWPICGPLGARLWCIEGAESHHNGAAVNPRSGAAGYLQWLPSTARAWGVQIGNRASEWNGAAQIAAQGERFLTSQWTVLQLGLC